MVTILLWVLAGIVLIDLLSIALGISRWRPVIFLQSVTVYLGPVALLVAIGGWTFGDSILVIMGTLETLWFVGLILVTSKPWRRAKVVRPHADTASLRVTHANLLHSNPSPDAAIDDVLSTDADVIAWCEITARLHDHAEGHHRSHEWPHRILELQDGPRGIAMWSRHPFTAGSIETFHATNAAVATIDLNTDTRLRIVAVHPMAPVSSQKTRDWAPSLRRIESALRNADLPTIAIGDFNASHWHPPMRRLLRHGLHSAHLQKGRVFSATFPVGRRLRPFVLLDHAIVTEDVVVHDLTHVTVRGSDHRGITVDVGTR